MLNNNQSSIISDNHSLIDLKNQLNDENMDIYDNIWQGITQNLSKCSPAVETFITNGTYYTFDNEDEMTPDKISIYCLNIVLDELQNVGISLHVDNDELYTYLGYMRLIIVIRYLVDPNVIKSLLEYDELYYNEIVDLISTGDSDTIKQYIIYAYANGLIKKLHLEYSYTVIDYESLTDYIVNNESFIKHMEAILNSFKPLAAEILQTSNTDYIKLITQVEQDRKDFKSAIEKLQTNGSITISNEVQEAAKQYDLEKLHENLDVLWVWIKTPIELTKEQKAIQKQIKHKHEIKNNHHLEYYLHKYQKENHVFTADEMILLVCHHYRTHMSREHMRQKMERMITLGNTMFNESNQYYMQKIATILMAGHR
jgi:hypothetical protein